MDSIDHYLAHLVDAVEGPKYTDNPADAGGPTKYGIKQATLSRHLGSPATANDVQSLTRETAIDIYHAQYVVDPGYMRIAALSVPVALEVIDTGVNCGPGTSTTILQRCLNVMNHQGNDWADIAVDGACGPATGGSLAAYMQQRGTQGERELLVALNCLQGARYIELAERREANETFVYGWIRARVQLSPDISEYGGGAT